MLLYIPPDTDMELPIGDDPQGGPGPDLAKVDQAAEFAEAPAAQGRTVVVRRYDNWQITYDLDAESVPL
ncbi:hypothetical protein [Nonomuraea jabiensis]|uniref:hypothetical protein n=1 Tax=Nonomuraea jabiensis TaxID=882448 RepID=UPI003D74D1A8